MRRVKLSKKGMSYENWQKIHKMSGTDFISMCMDYKHKRISSIQFMDIMEFYVEKAYKIGKREVAKK